MSTGVFLGPYELTSREPIGQGAMGVVLRARSPAGEDVAIKLLTRLDGRAVARFHREVRLQDSLGAAEGFVALLDRGESPQGPFLVMPFVAGGTLRNRFEQGPSSVEDTVALGLALARALGRAHSAGIVHRDLKPENVLFTGDGLPLVADLGLAKHFDTRGQSQSVALTRTGEFAGTAGYASPEQFSDSKSVGPEADVFSLGALLYECLAGRPAFTATNLIELAIRIDSGTHEPLEAARPDAPPWLVSVIERALAREPAARFPSGNELARALEAGAHPASRRSPRVAVGLVLVAAGASVAWWLATAKHREAVRACERGRVALDAGKLDDALAAYEQALALEANLAPAWCGRGAVKNMRGAYAGALADSTKAIELDPGLPAGWERRGATRLNLREIDGAIADLTRAIELAPRQPHPWVLRGEGFRLRGDLPRALADCEQALALDPLHVMAFWTRGNVKLAQQDQKGALADFGRAIELDPTNVDYRINRGDLLSKTGDHVAALAEATRAVSLGPQIAVAWGNKGAEELTLGQREAAVADLDRAIALDPTFADAWLNRAIALAVLGDKEGASASFSKALEQNPGLTLAWINRGAIHEEKGELDAAISDYERFLALEPSGPRAEEIREHLAELRK